MPAVDTWRARIAGSCCNVPQRRSFVVCHSALSYVRYNNKRSRRVHPRPLSPALRFLHETDSAVGSRSSYFIFSVPFSATQVPQLCERRLSPQPEHKPNSHRGRVCKLGSPCTRLGHIRSLKPAMVRVGPYELGATLGRGNYGLVKLAVNCDTGEQFAVKIVKKEVLQDEAQGNVDIKREIAIMKALDHHNIVALNDVLYSPKRVFLVMELVRGGELFESIVKNGRQPEDVARKYFHQLIDAVHYCHHRGIYHRDLKPENLLLGENGELKITDFGFSAMKDYGSHMLKTNCGSPHYCAPEVWNGDQTQYDGRKNDAWSCGIILYVMLTGKQPFYDEDDDILLDKVNAGVVDYPDYVSDGAKDLMQRLMQKNPKKRYSLSKVKRHPWFAVGYDAERDALLKQQVGRRERKDRERGK